MGDQVSWHVELAVKPGELDNFRTLTEEMEDSTRGEPGVLSSEFGRKFGGRFLGMVDRKRFTGVR